MCFLFHTNSALVLLLSLLMKCFVVSLCVWRGPLRSLILICPVSGCLERCRIKMPDPLNRSRWPLSFHCSKYNKHSLPPPYVLLSECMSLCSWPLLHNGVQNVVLRALLSSGLTWKPWVHPTLENPFRWWCSIIC